MSMLLQCKESNQPHPEGVHPAVCVDVIDLGLVEVEFQGQRKLVNKIKLVFESEQKDEQAKNCTVSKNFTASLHPKARLAEFLGKWRGRPIVPGETVDLTKLIGACCTLIISHQQNLVGRTYASIDAISKPTRKLTPSGQYDPADMRRRIADSVTRQLAGRDAATRTTDNRPATAPTGAVPPAPPKRPAPPAAPPTPPQPEYDPEVGF